MAREVVLVVDDHIESLNLTRTVLEMEGYHVITTFSGEECLSILEHIRPDIILTDIKLPGICGLELVQRVRAIPALRDIRVVAVTARAMRGDRELILAGGCDGYVSKPVDLGHLVSQVERHVRRGGPRSRPRRGLRPVSSSAGTGCV